MVKRKYSRNRGTLRGRGDYSESIPGIGSYTYKGNTPFASAGNIVGAKFGWPRVGGAIGHAVGRLFGSGDYKMGSTPNSNSIWNSTQTPKFAASGRGNIITNREYIGDVIVPATIGAQFNVSSYTINPGLASVFPWLGTISQQYEQYKIHGMIFEFKSTLGDNSGVQNVGTVIMGTEYNVNAPKFANKQVMENSEFAQSGKGTESQIHGIECAGKEHPLKLLFTKTSNGALAAGDSTKWYDFANFQIATVGFPAAGTPLTVGELWVSYQIEFFKPQIPSNIGGAVQSLRVTRSNASAAAYCGTIVNSSSGTLGFSCPTVNSITFTGLYVGNSYVLVFNWSGTAAVTTNISATATGGFSAKNMFQGMSVTNQTFGTPGAAVTTSSWEYCFTATETSGTMTFTAGVVPTASVFDAFVFPIDNSQVV